MVSNSNAGAREPLPSGSGAATRRGPRAASRAAEGALGARDAAAEGVDESTEALLQRYRRNGAHRLLAQVVERHRAIVEAMAAGLAARLPRSVDVHDLVHAGLWGLMQAIEAYEPARCDAFSAFMRIRVRGAMLDELRHLDFLPRLFRRRLRERDEVRQRLRMELEREPTDSELAAALGITEEALLRRADPTLVRAGAFGREAAAAGADEDQMAELADEGLESPIERLDQQEMLERIRQSLDPVEWRVLQLHYLEGLTGKQVARKLRLSASRICQIHGRVLDRLKARLAPIGSDAGG
ncbi:MAG: sigma-70 family RNA polymerase sigma factor [Planctomycetes bacterium]|nr:sigma-70 family RNA polymerase sigma factor [Planctomycetota bacterium]